MKEFSIKIPKALSEEIKPILEKHGFRSVSEFVLFSVRDLLREYQQIQSQHTNLVKAIQDRITELTTQFNQYNSQDTLGMIEELEALLESTKEKV